jgi:preprotein translocase subunit SecA
LSGDRGIEAQKVKNVLRAMRLNVEGSVYQVMIFNQLGRLPLVLVCLAVWGLGQTKVPETQAGRTLQAWLEVFNSGDRAKVEAYVKTIDTKQSVDGMVSFRQQTGGFDLLSIESSEPLHIRFRLKERAGRQRRWGTELWRVRAWM